MVEALRASDWPLALRAQQLEYLSYAIYGALATNAILVGGLARRNFAASVGAAKIESNEAKDG
jgi:hypothetical protein